MVAVLILVCGSAVAGETISGSARVVDGDTLYVGGVKIRLCGIQAPEPHERGGRKASNYLKSLTTGRTVSCIPVGSGTPCDGRSRRTSHDRIVAQCFVGDEDLAMSLVRSGNAKDWKRFSGGYYE